MVAFGRSIRNSWPVILVLLVALSFLAYRLANRGWDAIGIAELGTLYRDGDPQGSEGYDGQFAYYIATSPAPHAVSQRLDVPAYRYQRILYPLLARLLAFGQEDVIPWTLIGVNLMAHMVGASFLCRYLIFKGIAARYLLIYGLWVGLLVGIGADLYEPLAFSLVVAGWTLKERGKDGWGYLFLGLALFAKETSLPFWLAAAISDTVRKRGFKDLGIAYSPAAAFAIWQGWLWLQFGQMGLISGGANATPFEWLPYAGFFKIAGSSLKVFALFLVIFGPTIILPNLWGTVASIKKLLHKPEHAQAWALLLNALLITALPLSTFREPLGLLRTASGLVLAVILFSAAEQLKRPLNYAMFWPALLVVAFLS